MLTHEHTHTHAHEHEHAHPEEVHNPHRPDLAFALAKTFVLRLEIDGQSIDISDADHFCLTIRPKENGQRGNPVDAKGWVDEFGRVHLVAQQGPGPTWNRTINP